MMDQNQALKAWDLVKDAEGHKELRERVWGKVKHAFDPTEYTKFYTDAEEPAQTDEFAMTSVLTNSRLNWCAKSILNQHQSPVVDLGCSDGFFILALSRHGIECVGVNLNKGAIAVGRTRAWENNLPATFIQGDLRDHQGSYGAVVMMEVIEHLPNPEEAIAHAYSLVKLGGSLYLTTPRNDHYIIEERLKNEKRENWDSDEEPAGHLRLYTEEEFKELLKPYKIKQFILDEMRTMLVEIVKEV